MVTKCEYQFKVGDTVEVAYPDHVYATFTGWLIGGDLRNKHANDETPPKNAIGKVVQVGWHPAYEPEYEQLLGVLVEDRVYVISTSGVWLVAPAAIPPRAKTPEEILEQMNIMAGDLRDLIYSLDRRIYHLEKLTNA